MRNYLYYRLLMGTAFFCMLSSCSSSGNKTALAVTPENHFISIEPAAKPEKSIRLAPTTRSPEPTTGRSFAQKFQTPLIEVSEEENLKKLDKLFAKYDPPTEEFVIDPTTACSITSENGTQIYLQELSFKNEQGEIINEPITIQLKVCDNALAFLANNLVTETHDGRLLESGGMLHIAALLKDQKLVLDPGKEALVLFPKFGTDIPAMQSFYGVPDGDLVKWELNTLAAQESFEEPLAEALITIKKDKNLHLRIHEFTAKLNDRDVHWIMENRDKSLLDWLEEQDINGTKLQSWLSSPGRKIQTKLALNRKGKIKLMESDLVAHEAILDELQRLFDKAPALEIKSMSDFYNQTTLFLSFTGKKGVAEADDKIRNRVKRKYGNFKADLVDNFDEKELNNYILEINQLGWHNCDHFKEAEKKRIF